MKQMLKRFWQEEEGMGTVEIVIIIAVLVAVALIFRDAIMTFVEGVVDTMFPKVDKVTEGNQIP